MADLQIAPARQPSSAPAIILALVVLAALAAAIFYFNPHQVAELKVVNTDLYAPHTTFAAQEGPAAGGMHVLGTPNTSSEDDLYVIAHVSLTDKLRIPIYLNGATVQLTLADGSQTEANLLTAADLKRLEVIFPDITQHAVAPLSDGDEIDPGQTRTGTIVLPFPGQTADAWHSKKSAKLTLHLRNQGPLITALP